MSEVNVRIGNRIRKARKAIGMNQRTLARVLGIGRGLLSSVECGKRFLSMFYMSMIAKVCHKSMRFLVGQETPPDVKVQWCMGIGPGAQ